MYKPYQQPVTAAFADVKVPPPKISGLFIFIVNLLSGIYLFTLFGFAKIILKSDDILFDAFKRALNKDSRLLAAFRHPDGREPQLLTWFFLFRLKKLASKKKVKFAVKPHAIFVYGYEVARWGGWVARLFMPNLGAIPIHHTKLDSKGMARIYGAIQEGPYPLALAPEGQVSYSTDTVPRLESGTIRIGFQAACQMADKDVKAPLEILPISVHFRYGKNGKRAMEKLLKKIEKTCGYNTAESSLPIDERFKKCRNFILELNEARYGIKKDDSLSFEERLDTAVNAALSTAERMLGIKSEGDFFQRLYKVRHICWDNIYVPNTDDLDNIAQIKRSVMDLKAGESWLAARHQELADFGWYFRHPLPNEDTALHLKVEYVQNLWDFANRSMGGAISGRVNIPPKKVIIKAAPVINLSSRLADYKSDRKGTIAAALADLEKAYVNCIEEVNKSEAG